MRGGGRLHSSFDYNISLHQKHETIFANVVTKENLYQAWNDFVRGKRKRADVNEFAVHLVDNLCELYEDIMSGNYSHGLYEEYMVFDPKKRTIHKASVRDRVVHRLLYNALYGYFDSRFIFDSFSCRTGKGTHKARSRFRNFANEVSENYTRQCYVLKFDIKKCFSSIDRGFLKEILGVHIGDEKLYKLLCEVIDSFDTGLPLGNLTSQLFINSYLHELDWYLKQSLKVNHYLRYADDVVILGCSEEYLDILMTKISFFCKEILSLDVHKIQIKSIYVGVDVVGEIFFPHYMTMRRCTVRRMKKRS